jgi:hypothetical protein
MKILKMSSGFSKIGLELYYYNLTFQKDKFDKIILFNKQIKKRPNGNPGLTGRSYKF